MVEHWWDNLQYQCPSCKKYKAFYIFEETEKWTQKKCKFCGFLGYKKEIIFAEYKHEKGKTFLRTNEFRNFREVELVKTPEYMKVIPKFSVLTEF